MNNLLYEFFIVENSVGFVVLRDVAVPTEIIRVFKMSSAGFEPRTKR